MFREPSQMGRLVLLTPSGGVEAILATLPPAALAARAREEVARHPGRIVCGEWLDRHGRWRREVEALADASWQGG